MLKEAFSQLVCVFSPTVLSRGQNLQRKGHVLNVRLSDGLIKARVKGDIGQIYDVYIDLRIWPKKSSHCGCEGGNNCEHAVACLLELQARETKSTLTDAFDESLLNLMSDFKKNSDENNSNRILVYLLQPIANKKDSRIELSLASAKRLKRGGLSKKEPVNKITKALDKCFLEVDDEIVSQLFVPNNLTNEVKLARTSQSELIKKIILTERAYMANDSNVVISWGNAKKGELKWCLDIEGTQHLNLVAEDTSLNTLMLDKPFYIDNRNNVIGLLETQYTPEELHQFLRIAPVKYDQQAIREYITELPDFLQPKVFASKKTLVIKPIPILTLDAIPIAEDYYSFTRELSFLYQDYLVSSDNPATSLLFEENNQLIEVQRELTLEEEYANECEKTLPRSRNRFSPGKVIIKSYSSLVDAETVVQTIVPQLEKKGWIIKLNHSVFSPILDGEQVEWFAKISDESNFFTYQLGILINGKPVDIVMLVAELIGQLDKTSLEMMDDDKEVTLILPTQQRLNVKMGRLKPLIQFLIQYKASNPLDQQLKFTRSQFILVEETARSLASTSLRWLGGEHLLKQLHQLTTLQQIKSVPLPIGLKTVLRDYQHQGLNWLQFLREAQFGGILADDMGLGKTIQTLAHLQFEKEAGRLTEASLIISPTSLVGNWYEEALRFAPELKVLIFHGSNRYDGEFNEYDVIISTYGLVQRDKTKFVNHPFYYLILDEAQTIKNARAKTTLVIQQIKAKHRLCLSGTPLENHLGELWSLFNFVMPGLLGDHKQFKRFFKIPIERDASLPCQQRLANRVRPFMLRRTKNQVVNELPLKTEIKQVIELTGAQRDLYEAIRMSMEKKVREAIANLGINKSQIILLDALLKLRQVCCDSRLLSIPEAKIAHGHSAKLNACMELVDSLVLENRRMLLFSQFTSMLELIEEQLIARNYPYIKLTGQSQNRQQLVNRFQQEDIPIFLISLKAGGTGLNLTKADTVIHYDPWWNPAVEEQATGRSHRIGQKNPVFVYKLITAGTVEEAILSLQEKKRALFNGILTEDLSQIKAIQEEDIAQFFMPLI